MTAAISEESMLSGTSVSCSADINRAEWDGYVRAHNRGSFFHLSGWGEAIHSAYGFTPHYITARSNGALSGVLPLIDVRAPLLGRSLISTAFSVGGGPLADDDNTACALLTEAERIGAALKVRYVESRFDIEADGWLAKPMTHANFRLGLIPDETEALSAVPRKRRAELRKAIAAANAGEIAVRHDGDPGVFYHLYAKSLRRLGTPVFPKRFLNALLEQFGRVSEISVVTFGGAPVCALLTFYHGKTALPYYVGAEECARGIRAFDFLYWSVMRRAVERGCNNFDFGRSKIDSGAYKYKKLWGAEPEPLTYRVKLIRDEALPDLSADNPKFAFFSKTWPLLPLSVTTRLGPLLAPNFP